MVDLKAKVALGHRADSIYKTYLKNVIEQELGLLVTSLIDDELTVEKMLSLKREINAWKAVRNRVETDINTGKIAEKELQKELNNE